MSFANTVLAKDPSIGVIGLVPCAVGGTTLGEWSRGRKLYNDTIERTKAALKDGGAPRMDHKICGVGPGMSFANTVLAKDPSIGVIGLVPCAVGGTTLGEWSRGRKLYNDTIERTKAALKDGGAPRALLWFQGESDTSNLENAKSYNTHFEQFIAHVRCDLQLPTLPVVQVVVASGDGPFVKEVRESQMAVKLPELKKVDAWEVSLLADNVHLTVDSAIKVGHMMADAYLQFPSQ